MKFHSYSALAIFILFASTHSARAESAANALQQQTIHQQDQQKALQSQLDNRGKDVRAQPAEGINKSVIYVDEPGCKQIVSVVVDKDSLVPHWLPLQRMAEQATGHCMSPHNIKATAIILQNQLIASGYLTSRIQLPDQNVNNGEIKLKVTSGIVGKIFLQKGSDSYVQSANAFPTSSGDILDLRDIEQGLENMQNVPSTDVHINLVPSSKPGQTDIAIERVQQSFWRVAGWMDDSGSKYTGRYQAGAALYLDNPTSLNDLFYISGAHDLQNSKHLGNKNASASYTVPFGYWSFNVYASENEYHQALTGQYSDYQYRGKSKYISARLGRVLHRGAEQKTTLNTQVIKRNSHYYIGDTEMELQKLDLTNLRIALSHRHYMGDSVFDADLSFQRNVGWLGSKETASAKYGEASDISRIVVLDLQALIPFEFAGLSMSWQPRYYQQYSPDKLITQDKISMGNRWSVRGFDGENTLLGNRGWYLLNTVNIDMPPSWNNQLYLGIDYGRVSGSDQDWIKGRSITGGTVGLRGYKWKTGYDFFAGMPVSKPQGLSTDGLTLGFNLQWMY